MESKPELQTILNSIRQIVKTVMSSSKQTENNLGLSTSQIFVLRKLAECDQPISINELAKVTFTGPNFLAKVVSKLVSRKLVDRFESIENAQTAGLKISEQGEYLLSKCPKSIQDRLIEGVLQLSASEQLGLARGLQTLIQKTGIEKEEPSMLLED